MAHHHHPPTQPHDEGKEHRDVKIHTTGATTPKSNNSSHEVNKEQEDALRRDKRKSIFDYQIAGFSWPFILVMSLMAVAVFGMILKVMGVF